MFKYQRLHINGLNVLTEHSSKFYFYVKIAFTWCMKAKRVRVGGASVSVNLVISANRSYCSEANDG